MDYTWFFDSDISGRNAEYNIRAFFDFGLSGLFYIMPSLALSGSFVLRDEHNPLNQSVPNRNASERRYNAHFAVSVKYTF